MENECEYSEDDQIWYCMMESYAPPIDEGNHTMVLTTEDLEVGSNYTIWLESTICEDMSGCDYQWMEFDFTQMPRRNPRHSTWRQITTVAA